ncbi:mitosis inhibitor protein kinase swe1 [Pestalotiopsis sp. IQ-011]
MSFGNSGGGTLTLPSPTHPNSIDVQAAVVRSLRRSISRSPSKFHLARTASQGSDASMSSIPNSPSPASPSLRRMASQQFGAFSSQNNAPTTQSVLAQPPLATPFRPSVKLSLRSSKSSAKVTPSGSSTSSKSSARSRTSPRSPTKRALNPASPCAGNSTPPSSSSDESPPSGQENISCFRVRSPGSRRRSFERSKTRHSMHLDMSGASLQAIARSTDSTLPSVSASPLKRSDATMDLDQATFGSPKAKRRSYGPANFAADFNFLEPGHISPGFDIHDEASREYDWSPLVNEEAGESFASPLALSLPRRTSSLRQSTLQQRQAKKERTSWGRRSGAQHLSQMSNEAATPARSRPRVASDQFQPLARESLFSAPSPSPLPVATAQAMNPIPNQPHPLSRTVTASSSNSSIPDESPTHYPVFTERPRPRGPMNWSKSLPIGAMRPVQDDEQAMVGSISTPDYKHAKPFMGAFASTGLVSKMRNPELEPLVSRGAPVPDTPCKGRVSPFHTFPPLLASNVKSRPRNARSTLGAFGGPSTPFAPKDSRSPVPNTFGSQNGRPNLFTSFGTRHGRSNSTLSLYSDDGRSPTDLNGDTPMTAAEDVPPTPTRPAQFLAQASNDFDLMTNDSPTANRHISAPVTTVVESSWQQDSAASPSPLDRFEFAESTTPRTPHDSEAASEADRLSKSTPTAGFLFPTSSGKKSLFPPATPTARQSGSLLFPDLSTVTPTHGNGARQIDSCLASRFANVDFIGQGEFSEVFKVTEKVKPMATPAHGLFSTPTHRSPASSLSEKVFAVKKLKLPLKGTSDRAMRMREVQALEAMRGCEHVLQLADSWEELNNLYIQTEYCEEGSLDVFLAQVGVKGKLDDFRIWKVMLELSLGLKHIHDAGFVHLDLKPSNILIDFEGTLKIGDFGMAAALPVVKGPDFEGDREYLAFEVLRGEIDKPADIFSLGLIMLEVAANVKLPDNGATWQALRCGDFSEIPILTKPENDVIRDATGLPIEDTDRNVHETPEAKQAYLSTTPRSVSRQPRDLFGLARKNELMQPPAFMLDSSDSNSLDSVIRWMLTPDPPQRPIVSQILELHAMEWVAARCRAGATVFEGSWGPADEPVDLVSLDTEMTDV